MGAGDAYKPASATRPKPEPEIYPGTPAPHCAHCGDEIKTGVPYVRKGDRVFHSAEPCKGAWLAYTPSKHAEAVLMEPPWPPPHDFGPGAPARVERLSENVRPGLVDKAREEIDQLLKGPAERGVSLEAGRMVGAARGLIEQARFEAEQDDPQTASGEGLDRLAALLGTTRIAYGAVSGGTAIETDNELRKRLLKTIQGKTGRSAGIIPPNADASVLRVYVAGASKEPHRCRAAMRAIETIGGIVTLDWLAAIEAEGAANEGLDDEKRRKYALADLEGVRSADLVWLLASPFPTTGSWTELGAALIFKRLGYGAGTIVVSGPARERSIFAALADFETDQDLEALAWIKNAAKLKAEGLG